MQTVLKLACTLVILLCAAFAGLAQTADKVLKQSLKALGGEQAVKRINARQWQGRITRLRDGATGAWQLVALRPSLLLVKAELNGFEQSEAYNGKSGWQRDSRDGVRTLTGEQSAAAQAEALYRNSFWLEHKREKLMLGFAGQTTVNGKAAQVVTLTTPRNARLKLFFDVASGLPVREEVTLGETVKTYEFADFHQVDGVAVPFQIALSYQTKEETERYEIKLDSVKHNQPLDRAQFDFPAVAQQPLPDLNALISEIRRTTAERERLLDDYGYLSLETEREFDKAGSLKKNETRQYEYTRHRERRLRRLVAVNGQPLSPAEQRKEDERIADQIREIEKELAEAAKKPHARRREGGRNLTLGQALRASKLLNPRWERFRGREVIVFDFEPNPAYKPRDLYEKLVSKLAGAIWVDPQARQVVRMEQRTLAPYRWAGGLAASLALGALVVTEYDFINNEVWLPVYTEVNMAVRVFLAVGVKVNRTIRNHEFKKFKVEAEAEKLKVPH